MAKIKSIEKQTENRFLNMYQFNAVNKLGKDTRYFVASRSERIEDLKANTGKNTPDGVVIYSLYGEKKDKVVLLRQFRMSIGTYVYELPAGLCDPNEDFHDSAVREMHEETGLDFHPIYADPSFEAAGYTTVGMTDESCATVFGYSTGEVSKKFLEDSEEIEVILADKEEVRRIMKEEHVAIICRYQLMHFLHDERPFAFLGE